MTWTQADYRIDIVRTLIVVVYENFDKKKATGLFKILFCKHIIITLSAVLHKKIVC